MGTDITFDDLAGGSRTKDGSEPEEVPSDDDGPDLLELAQFLDDRGYLQQLLDLQQATQGGGRPSRAPADAIGDGNAGRNTVEATPEATDDTSKDIDSETIAQALKQVYDIKGNISLKELIQLVEENGEMVDNLLEQEL